MGVGTGKFGIDPAVTVATFLDPRFKALGSDRKANDKEAIQVHVLNLMKEIEQKNHDNAPEGQPFV